MAGEQLPEQDQVVYKTMLLLRRHRAGRCWLHIGAVRNNTPMFQKLGADDSIPSTT